MDLPDITSMKMKYKIIKQHLPEFASILINNGPRFTLRHLRLCRRVYYPWLRQKIEESGAFDRRWYREKYIGKGKKVVIDPLDHYLLRGSYYNLWPNASFDPIWHRIHYMPRKSRLMPIIHYILRYQWNNGNTVGKPWPIIYPAGIFEKADLYQVNQIHNRCSKFSVYLTTNANILDFGCGEGKLVAALRYYGYQAYGYDIISRPCRLAMPYKNYLFSDSSIIDENKKIPGISNYSLKNMEWRLPFPDNFFELVISNQVFEHVFNHDATMREISRILKPGGWYFNIWPSKSGVVETHVNVPFGHRLQWKWWFYLWSAAGMCCKLHKELSIKERAWKGYGYIQTATNYISDKKAVDLGTRYFRKVEIQYYPHVNNLNIFKIISRKLFSLTTFLACRK